MQSYLDYRLTLVGDQRVRVQFTDSCGQQRDDSGILDAAALMRARALGTRIREGSYCREDLVLLGNTLYRTLFPSTVESHLREAIREASGIPQGGLRLRLEIDPTTAPDLVALPWEFLHCPGDAHSKAFWLATHTRLVFSRYWSLREAASALMLNPREKLRILLVAVNASDLSIVSFKPVWEAIQALSVTDASKFESPILLTDATPRLVDETLYDYQPHIFHLIAHGRLENGIGHIALLNPKKRESRWCNAEDFTTLFESCIPGLVLLQACESGTASAGSAFVSIASKAVQSNVPVVVAMQYPVSNRQAADFACEVYRALSNSEPVDAAVQLGRRVIGQDCGWAERHFGTPALYMRVKDGRFIDQRNELTTRVESPISSVRLNTVDSPSFQVVHNLPQRSTEHFVGRQAYLDRIHRIIGQSVQGAVILIDGASGVGKTAVAIETAYYYLAEHERLPQSQRFDAIIWISAKTSILTAEGALPREKSAASLEDLFATIAFTLDSQCIVRSMPAEQSALVHKALLKQRTLLIVDNLETIHDDRLLSFLRELPPTVVAIVTSRKRFDIQHRVHLDELSAQEACALIREESIGQEVELQEEQIGRLYGLTGGTPLAIVWSIAQMAFTGDPDLILRRLESGAADLLSFCFSESLEHIANSRAREILLALSLFISTADRKDILDVSGVSESDTSSELELAKLQVLSLIEVSKSRYYMLPLTRRLVSFEIQEDQAFLYQAQLRFAHVMDRLLREKAEAVWAQGLRTNIWEHDRDNVFAAIVLCHEMGYTEELVQMVVDAYPFVITYGPFQQYLDACAWALAACEEPTGLQSAARVHVRMASIYHHAAMPIEAQEHLQLTRQIIDRLDTIDDELRNAYNFVRSIIAVEHDAPDAEAIIREALEFEQRRGIIWTALGFMGWLGVLWCRQKRWQDAEHLLLQALEIAQQTHNYRSQAFISVPLIRAMRAQGRLEEADEMYRAIRDIAEQYAEQHNRAHLYFEAAKIQAALGDFQMAASYAVKAQDLYSQLGIRAREQECCELLAEIESNVNP